MNPRSFVRIAAAFLAFAAFAAEDACAEDRYDPVSVGKRIMRQFLSTEPCDYRPVGYDGEPYGKGQWLPYAAASWWANGIDFAMLTGDAVLERELVRRYAPYCDGGKYARSVARMHHVDDAIAGVVPLAIYLANGDEAMKRRGLVYADTQWTPPCEKSLRERHAATKEEQERYWAEGYTPQTRLWIDDMYMIIALQTMAYRATGDRKYLERTAKEMCLYLEKLQLKEGDVKGLFYHAPDVPYVWGRGDGWMAAGMALVLSHLDPCTAHYGRILAGYRDMMAALLRFQRPDGLWGQLVNDPKIWAETSGSAMFAYAFLSGVRHGWLDRKTYGAAAERAWKALCDRLDEHANLSDVCIGTGKQDDHRYYVDRRRINGDPHGEAPMMWCANEMVRARMRPTLPGFHPDPSICRVGDWYYLTTSSFTWFPGLPIYRSRDLRNWEHVGDALADGDWRGVVKLHDMRGVWAPTIRHHDGLFHIVCNERFRGENFVITAKDPAGPWSKPVFLEPTGIDPSPFWEDGRFYVTAVCDPHDGKRLPGRTEIYLQEADPTTGRAIGPRHYLTTGAFPDSRVAEGAHIYRRNGRYWLLIAEGGMQQHAATLLVADRLTGPYAPCRANPVLTVRDRPDAAIRAAGHADLVEGKDGRWYAAFLAVRKGNAEYLGRETFVCPVDFTDDGIVAHVDDCIPGTVSELPGYRYETSVPDLRLRRVTEPDFTESLKVVTSRDGVGAGLVLYRSRTGYYLLTKERSTVELLRVNGPRDLDCRIVARVDWRDDEAVLALEVKGVDVLFSVGKSADDLRPVGEKQPVAVIRDGCPYNGPGVGAILGRRMR